VRFVRHYPIRFSHCDAAGIVFYPQYFMLFNDHVEDWFNEGLKEDFRRFHVEHRMAIPTARIECDFVAPSRIGDSLAFWLEVERLGSSSVQLKRGADCAGVTRVKLAQTLVCVDQDNGKPRPWPGPLRAAIAQYSTGHDNGHGATPDASR
jgi:4-hydroxybenzoyl-CoA thioesterase